MRSLPTRARADYVFKDHTPSAMRGDARLRGRERIICSKTISPPEALSYRLSSIDYSSAPQQALLSVIGYQLSAIGYRLSAIVQCRFDDTLLRRPSTGSAVAFCSPRNPGAGFTQLSSDAEKIMHWRRNCPGRSPGDATATAEQAWSENDRPPGSALLPVTLENNMP